MRHLEKNTLQQLCLMVGSRQALMTYLGMERKEFDQLWKEKGLLAPVDYARKLAGSGDLAKLVLAKGSYEKAADHLGVSASFVKTLIDANSYADQLECAPNRELTAELVDQLKSIRFIARMTGLTEGQVRKFIELNDLSDKIQYDLSNHNNAKGRRAETYWASLRPDTVTEDCNVTMGSQAPYDFVDSVLGKVNVKASARHAFRARTRKQNPYYWKFSTNGLDVADVVACVLYDSKMQLPLHVFNLKVEPWMLQCSSFTLQVVKGSPHFLIKK